MRANPTQSTRLRRRSRPLLLAVAAEYSGRSPRALTVAVGRQAVTGLRPDGWETRPSARTSLRSASALRFAALLLAASRGCGPPPPPSPPRPRCARRSLRSLAFGGRGEGARPGVLLPPPPFRAHRASGFRRSCAPPSAAPGASRRPRAPAAGGTSPGPPPDRLLSRNIFENHVESARQIKPGHALRAWRR